jgi:ubiquinol-cytochrome c reductase cytochrome b subunit
MWHIVLLPLAVGAVVVLHVLLVRVHGVVPPLEAAETDAQLGTDARVGTDAQLGAMTARDSEAIPEAGTGGAA